MLQYIDGNVDAVIFNLGYLPGAAHDLTTKAQITIEALQQCLKILNVGGIISIVTYPGHPEGLRENSEVRKFLALLPQSVYSVGCWSMLNQVNDPPVLYLIEKISREVSG